MNQNQNREERLIVIANPRSAGGRTGAARDNLHRAVERAFAQAELWWTEAPGHATELAKKAAEKADIVAALGGDGTCHEVVNGLVVGGKPVNRKVIFTVIPSGTGGDLKRSLSVPPKPEDALWIAATGMTLHLDLGVAQWEDGREEVFINVAGFGANAEVCRRANQSSKKWGGAPTFLKAIAETLADYEPRRIRWRLEGPGGSEELVLPTLSAFCGNGHYCGAGLWIGKGGSMADGLLDWTLLQPFPLTRAPGLLPRFYDGTLGKAPGVIQRKLTRLESCDPISLELDGEPRPEAKVIVSVLPRILQVRGGWLRPPTLS